MGQSEVTFSPLPPPTSLEDAEEGELPLQLKEGWSQEHAFSFLCAPTTWPWTWGKVIGTAQNNSVNKTPAFWRVNQKGETPGNRNKPGRL